MADVPISITFKDFESSQAAAYIIRERAERLGEIFDRITSCHIFVARPEARSKQKKYNIRIHLVIPGKEFESNRESQFDDVNHDLRLAVDASFDHLERELLSFLKRRRHQHRERDRAQLLRTGESNA
jgi:ribosome-associated translation inhibitor RaiA